jgi:hypothetical protein
VSDLKARLQKLEEKKPQGLPPLHIKAFFSTEEKERLRREAIEQYGLPPLFISLQREGQTI